MASQNIKLSTYSAAHPSQNNSSCLQREGAEIIKGSRQRGGHGEGDSPILLIVPISSSHPRTPSPSCPEYLLRIALSPLTSVTPSIITLGGRWDFPIFHRGPKFSQEVIKGGIVAQGFPTLNSGVSTPHSLPPPSGIQGKKTLNWKPKL